MAVAVRFKVIGCIIFIGPKPSGLYRVETIDGHQTLRIQQAQASEILQCVSEGGFDVVQRAMMQRIGTADMEISDSLLTQSRNDRRAAEYQIAQPHSRNCRSDCPCTC